MEKLNLEDLNIDRMTESEAKEALKYLQKQFQTTYKYFVGEWGGVKHCKSTRTGLFVENDEVIKWLKN